LPQQMQMMLFAAFAIFDKKNAYKQLTQKIVKKRYDMLFNGIGVQVKPDPNRAGYYAEIDLMIWARKKYGKGFTDFLKKNYEPVDVLFRLAELCSVVLLNGSGFDGPEWSIRVSLANLDDDAYPMIGKAIDQMGQEYVDEWEASKKS
jgi:aspartate 4-decarboxylase